MVADALAEFAPHWITLNEPYCSAIIGYAEGRHAPGAREGHGALAAAHHLLLGHGLAVAGAAATGAAGGRRHAEPVAGRAGRHSSAADRRGRAAPGPAGEPAVHSTRCWRRATRADYDDVWGDLTDFSFVHDGDLAMIAAPLDFLGVNYYYRIHVRRSACQRLRRAGTFRHRVRHRGRGR